MKKITFILFALIGATTFAQGSATETAVVSADIVSPITLVHADDFRFGQISNTGGTVIIATDNTVTGTATNVGASAQNAAAFTVNAADGYVYSVTLPGTVALTNQTGAGNETMTVSALVHDAGTTPTGTGGDESLKVGGTLTVAPSQVVGYYEGEIEVTVTYN